MANSILRPGFAHFEIIDVITMNKEGGPLTSRNGDPMCKLKVSVTDMDGVDATIYDYVLPTTPWKMNQIQKCLDIDTFYNNGEWERPLLMYKSGMCTVKTQPAKDRYEECSVIGSYMSKDAMKMLLNAPGKESALPAVNKKTVTETEKVEWLDDDIPF